MTSLPQTRRQSLKIILVAFVAVILTQSQEQAAPPVQPARWVGLCHVWSGPGVSRPHRPVTVSVCDQWHAEHAEGESGVCSLVYRTAKLKCNCTAGTPG